MSKPHKEGLSHYVDRVMKKKHLSRRDVKLRSGGDITDSYVSGIVSGSAKNLSVEKLKALARGLRVPEMELVRVAFGLWGEDDAHRFIDESHDFLLVDLKKKTVISADVAEIVEGISRLTPAGRAAVLQLVKRLVTADRRVQKKRRSG